MMGWIIFIFIIKYIIMKELQEEMKETMDKRESSVVTLNNELFSPNFAGAFHKLLNQVSDPISAMELLQLSNKLESKSNDFNKVR